jgi:hypothetical protein
MFPTSVTNAITGKAIRTTEVRLQVSILLRGLKIFPSQRQENGASLIPDSLPGAKVAGKIVVDMTFLRTEGHIRPIKSEHTYGKLHYRVEYELVMIVDGLNIKYEARWKNGQEVRVIRRKQINIAAAFASLETDDQSEDGNGYLTD